VPVAGRTVDRDPGVEEPLAGRVNILDRIRQVAEVAAAGVFLRVPVVSQLNLGPAFVARRGQEDQGEAPLLVADAADFLEADQLEKAAVASGSLTRIMVWRYLVMAGFWGLRPALSTP
jgi:hypothetical protein